jgi:hypothetical protein
MNKKALKIAAITGGVLTFSAVTIAVVLVFALKKKTSTSSLYKFPDIGYYTYVLTNEDKPTNFKAVYLGQLDPILFDAQWCSQVRQQLSFEFVKDGLTPDTKIFRIRQTMYVKNAYLTYDPAAVDLISQKNYTDGTEQLWDVKYLPGVTSGHIEISNGATLGVYNITNVATGKALGYVLDSNNTEKITLLSPNPTSIIQRWSITRSGC